MLVAIWLPPLNTLYPVTPTLSVDAVQARLICEEEIGVAVRLVGTVGGVVSGGVVSTVYIAWYAPASEANCAYEIPFITSVENETGVPFRVSVAKGALAGTP